MSAPSAFHFYQDTFHHVSSTLEAYIGTTAQSVIGAITGVAYSMLMIYMMLWGWTMLRGMISEPITDGLARIVRLAVIVGIALSIDRYKIYISNFLWAAPDAMANYVASGYSSSTNNILFLDNLMSKIYDLGDAYWKKANASTIPNVGGMLVAILIWAAGVAATAYGAFLLALSKMALAILLGIGPIFVLLLVFEGTKKFFEAWLSQALNYVFLVILTAGAIKLILTVLETYLGAAAAVGENPGFDQALPCIVMCIISALVMMQLPSIASALGGGAAISTLGAAAWAYGKTTTTAAAMRPTAMRRSIRNARADIRIAGGAVGAVANAPMAVYRRITGGGKNRAS